MQVSIKWLNDYINFNETAEELADKYTMAGVSVENVIRADAGLDKVVTGKIEQIEPHPDSDHLQICQMNVGAGECIQIITGAQNVREGQIVPVAMIGAHLPNGLHIKKGKLRGLPSNGMLCSAEELHMDLTKLTDEQKNGIYILPPDTPVGVPAKDVLGLDDVVLEFELTANRGDCFSVLGLVREAAVLTGNVPHYPDIQVREDDEAAAADLIKVDIEATELCNRFSARVIRNVKIGPSPEWMQQRLEGAGIRSINNVVDVTNFVMIELGQPMHAYDYDEIKGHHLTARVAEAGENLHTLDDSSRVAKGTELVIADEEKPAGLAGIMGGLETEVTEKTTTVVLEAASFNGPNIRRTSRACGLHSEASGRFERGVDVSNTPRALDRACQLLQDMGACTVTKGVVDVYPAPKPQVRIDFTVDEINRRLGTQLPGSKMIDILERLGFGVRETASGAYQAVVPSWRNDCTYMEDLSEEISRIYGFDNIPSTTPFGRMMQGRQSLRRNFIDRIKHVLAGLGMTEELSFSFTNTDMLDKMCVPSDSKLRRAIPIMNPLTDEYPLVRTSLLTSIMENAVRNFSRKNTDIRIFDVAPVFYPKALPVTEQPDEVIRLAGLITGRRHPVGWNQSNEMVDFYDMKGIVEELFRALSISGCTVEAGEHFAMHPGKTALFKKGREVIATVGELHPAVAANFGIKQKVYLFEMDVETLMKYTAKNFHYKSLPKYPAIARDLAIVVDEDAAASDIEAVIARNGGAYFKGVTLFDVYTGEHVAAGKKSLAFNLQFQSSDKTLTDEEADAGFQSILEAVKTQFRAELRA
ncbi:phenylalanine--tRNA ligase subunit beta [Selenomonas sp. WCA-380-WT-3B 3/]|uniref:Phenylalanine--tRNA ligase beta subunit n=1 Tax=Selenomonas montiformis TaxID=2652285 RepID=A0A6I2V002_9FIRM|nr:phenylalanine--tRNA ligase subunit beta [Selenomonas montiformis]MSV25670.1 phenylalanine--tRNA ligase subunit beta [Selenomonas montiformis]